MVGLVTEWKTEVGETEVRDADSDKGGTMRLGGQGCNLVDDSLAQLVYNQAHVVERHRHRYEVNGSYVPQLEAKGMKVSGYSEDSQLVEIVELPNHPWFLGCQFHPEFTSTPREGHPLFNDFIKAAKASQE